MSDTELTQQEQNKLDKFKRDLEGQIQEKQVIQLREQQLDEENDQKLEKKLASQQDRLLDEFLNQHPYE